MRRARRAGLALALAGALSCGGDATGPRAGTLEIRLTTVNAPADRAILFTVAGPAAPVAASAPAGLRIFFDSLGADIRGHGTSRPARSRRSRWRT
jgi:hypothetical protein